MMLLSMMRSVIYNKITFEKNNNTEILKTQCYEYNGIGEWFIYDKKRI